MVAADDCGAVALARSKAGQTALGDGVERPARGRRCPDCFSGAFIGKRSRIAGFGTGPFFDYRHDEGAIGINRCGRSARYRYLAGPAGSSGCDSGACKNSGRRTDSE